MSKASVCDQCGRTMTDKPMFQVYTWGLGGLEQGRWFKDLDLCSPACLAALATDIAAAQGQPLTDTNTQRLPTLDPPDWKRALAALDHALARRVRDLR